jgi:glycerophosphoryl diester phosphodiesterase
VLALPFLAGAAFIWFVILGGHDINYYLAEHPPEWRRAILLAAVMGAGFGLLAAWQLARWLYAVPTLVFGDMTPAQALETSARMTRGRLTRIVSPLVIWWLLLTAATVAITWVCRQVSDAGLDWAGIDFQRVLPLVALYLVVTLVGGFLSGGLLLGGHQFLVTRIYAEQSDASRWRVPPTLEIGEERSRLIARPALLATLAFLALAFGAGWLMASRLDLEPDVAITAHRGASIATPENTMAAFRAAMDAGATYSELDVQRTRDGQIAVLHDGDLMRMAGDPRKLGELTAIELATIDICQRYDAAFAEASAAARGGHRAVRGRMKLNVELKYNVPDPDLVPAVLDLLRRERFLDQVVITSLDAALRSRESRADTAHGPHRDSSRRRRRSHGGGLPEPELGESHAGARAPRACRGQGSARLDGQQA